MNLENVLKKGDSHEEPHVSRFHFYVMSKVSESVETEGTFVGEAYSVLIISQLLDIYKNKAYKSEETEGEGRR